MDSRQVVHVVGYNVLVEPMEQEKKTASGIVLPDEVDEENEGLIRGTVRNVGPGLLIPTIAKDKDDISSIIEGDMGQDFKAAHVPLDIQEGDIAYYPRRAADDIRLDGKTFMVVPYPAIKVFVRDMK